MIRNINLKMIKNVIIIVSVVLILFINGIMLLKYQVEGETNLPFKITKIIVVSSSGGTEKENSENKWAMDISQNNDIYMYIEKNSEYRDTEIINEIKLENFQFKNKYDIGENNIYKPSEEKVDIFYNTENNKVSQIIYKGDIESNVKSCKISNQGGLVVFRVAKDKIGEYISNDAIEVNHNLLISSTGITNEELKGTLSFDIIIDLVGKKTYKATANINLPVGDVVNNATTNLEITDLNDIVFRRIEN